MTHTGKLQPPSTGNGESPIHSPHALSSPVSKALETTGRRNAGLHETERPDLGLHGLSRGPSETSSAGGESICGHNYISSASRASCGCGPPLVATGVLFRVRTACLRQADALTCALYLPVWLQPARMTTVEVQAGNGKLKTRKVRPCLGFQDGCRPILSRIWQAVTQSQTEKGIGSGSAVEAWAAVAQCSPGAARKALPTHITCLATSTAAGPGQKPRLGGAQL